MKGYFVLYKQHDHDGSVEILGVYENDKEAAEAEEKAISNSGFFETVHLEEVYM